MMGSVRKWRLRVGITGAFLLVTGSLHAQDKTSGPWVMQSSGTTASLRGIHAVGAGVAWASGTNGTVLRTEDGGYMWQTCAMPPGAEKLDFRGFIFFGLMLTADGPQVLEYNVRMGDPETQSIVRRARFDLAQVCYDAASGKLDPSVVKWTADASLCVVIASEGYPGDPVVGLPIKGLAEAGDVRDVVVFHAGTRREDDGFYTHGGRVLGVSATGASLEEARAAAYSAASKIRIQGAHYRSDIGLASSDGSDTGASGAAS